MLRTPEMPPGVALLAGCIVGGRPSLAWAAALLLLPLAAGCGSGESGPTDEEQVAAAVSNLSDAAGEPERFQTEFAAGTAPPADEIRKYREYMFRVKSIEIAGDTATAQVEVEHGVSGEILGEMPWTLVREGEAWKATAAPLP